VIFYIKDKKNCVNAEFLKEFSDKIKEIPFI